MPTDRVRTALATAHTTAAARTAVRLLRRGLSTARTVERASLSAVILHQAVGLAASKPGTPSGSRRLSRLAHHSWILTTAHRHTRRITNTTHVVLDRAAVTQVVAWIGRVTRASWGYRWLTAEPDPDVIVIDLRDTWTTGPIITALDTLTAWLAPATTTAQLPTRLKTARDAVVAAPIRAISIVTGTTTATWLILAVLTDAASPAGVAVAIGILLGSIAGLRITMPLAALLDTRVVQLLAAALEPPDPPDEDP